MGNSTVAEFAADEYEAEILGFRIARNNYKDADRWIFQSRSITRLQDGIIRQAYSYLENKESVDPYMPKVNQ